MLVALAPFVALEVLRGAQDVERRRAAVVERTRAGADGQSSTMDDFIRFTERFLLTLAGTPAVQALDGERTGELLHATRRANPNYENVFLLAANGVQVVSTEPLVSDPAIADQPYFREALDGGRLAISGVVAWPGSGRSVVVLAYPVTTAAGERVGVLAIALNVARLRSVLGSPALPQGSVVLLVHQDGTVIAADAPETWVGRTLMGTPLLAAMTGGATGTLTATVVDDTRRVYGYHRQTLAPWVMVAGIPRSEVDAELWRNLGRVLQQFVLAGAAAALLAILMARWIVAPIRALADGARAFATGRLDQRIHLHRGDELGELAGSLNTMAGALEYRLAREEAHRDQLERMNAVQAEFVSVAAHELRTPITAVRGYAEALLRPDITDEAVRRTCLEGINRGSARLSRLVQALLDVSRIDSERLAITVAPVAVPAIVQAALEQVYPHQPEAATVSVLPGLPPAAADAERLEDVLVNLLSNARQFSPESGSVAVTVRALDHEVLIAVSDRGPGIDAEELPHIFERFYQVQRGSTRRSGGAGLGLYISRAYVRAMGGRLAVESTPGAGSVFTVAVPQAAAEPAFVMEEADADHAFAVGG